MVGGGGEKRSVVAALLLVLTLLLLLLLLVCELCACVYISCVPLPFSLSPSLLGGGYLLCVLLLVISGTFL